VALERTLGFSRTTHLPRTPPRNPIKSESELITDSAITTRSFFATIGPTITKPALKDSQDTQTNFRTTRAPSPPVILASSEATPSLTYATGIHRQHLAVSISPRVLTF
jgi:hypothetical protein